MNFVLAMDFDGTLFHDPFGSNGQAGQPIMPVILHAKKFCDHPRYEVVLWTCRDGHSLTEAVRKCESFGLSFHAVNANSREAIMWSALNGLPNSVKIFADMYVDDRAGDSIGHFMQADPKTLWHKTKDRKIA